MAETTAADKAKRRATFAALAADPSLPEESRRIYREQAGTASAVRAFQQGQAEPETPQARVRSTTSRVTAEARRSPFALPDKSRIDESQQGVTISERLLLKNLATNPEVAANWLRAKGYEAYLYEPGQAGTEAAGGPVASKMRIAVRKPGEQDFKVVDPAGFDAQDITDLFGDLIFGAAVPAAAAAGFTLAGPPGAVGGGALAGGVLEEGRQALGRGVTSLFGQPPLNPPGTGDEEIGAQMIGGGLAAPMGEATGFLGRTATKAVGAVGEAAKRVAGGTLAGLTRVSREQLAHAVEQGAVILQPLVGDRAKMLASSLAQRTMQFLTGLDESRTGEYQAAQGLLKSAGGGQVRVRPVLEAIRNEITSPFHEVPIPPEKFMGIPVSGPSAPILRPRATTAGRVPATAGRFGLASAENDRVRQILVEEASNIAKNAGADSVEEAIHRDLTIPAEMADALKRTYAEAANYSAEALNRDTAKEAAHKTLADGLRRAIRESIPDPAAREQYGTLMTQAGKKLGLAKEFQKALVAKGAEEIAPEEGAAEEIVQAANRPEQFFRTYLNRGARSGQQGLVREFGRLWAPELQQAGIADLETAARDASTLAAYGAEGSDVFGGTKGIYLGAPTLSFGGRPMGMALGAGLGFGSGYLAGGLPGAEKGALIGGGLGFYAGSPRGSIQTMRAIKAGVNKAAEFGSLPGEIAASKPVMFGAGGAGAQATAETGAAAGRQEAEATRRQQTDDETMRALSDIASEVRKMAAANPALTAEQMSDEFSKRANDYLTKRKLVMASP